MICPNCSENGNTVNLIIDRKKKRTYESSPGSGQRIRECICKICGGEYTVSVVTEIEYGHHPPVVTITESIITDYPS